MVCRRLELLILLLTCLSSCVALVAADPRDSGPVAFAIGLGNGTEATGDVRITGRLTNRSAAPILLKNRYFLGPDIRLDVTDASGRTLSFLPPAPPPPLRRDDFVDLVPGGSVELDIGVLNRMLTDPLAPGIYRLSARFIGSKGTRLGLNAYDGVVYSNVYTLRYEMERNDAQE